MKEEWSAVQTLLKSSSEAAMATLEQGRPYVSAVGYVLEDEVSLTVAVLLSRLARHTRNLEKNPVISLLIQEEQREVPVHQRVRASLLGEAGFVQGEDRVMRLKQFYLERFPQSQLFFSLPDFRFYAVRPSEIHWIGGFGQAKIFRCIDGRWE